MIKKKSAWRKLASDASLKIGPNPKPLATRKTAQISCVWLQFRLQWPYLNRPLAYRYRSNHCWQGQKLWWGYSRHHGGVGACCMLHRCSNISSESNLLSIGGQSPHVMGRSQEDDEASDHCICWYGDGSKPWYLVNPKIAGKWMFIPLKMYL